MPRLANTPNKTDYKYKVEELNNVRKIINTTYFLTQKQIQDKYNLKRSAIYFMLYKPEKILKNTNFIITKLDIKLPVFEKQIIEDEGDIYIHYQRIIY